MKNRIDWQNVIIPQSKEFIKTLTYRPTIRQIFYVLVSRLLIPNTMSCYKRLDRALTLARERRIIDPLAFADRKRFSSQGDYGWQNLEGFVEDQKEAFRESWQFYTRPLWTSQQILPILWIEKGALYPAVVQIADKYRVKVYEARGYSSFTQVYESAKEFEIPNLSVLYLSDFDPSGEDMPRDVKNRLQKYGAGEFTFKKLALTKEQVMRYELPTIPAKKSDPRFKNFVRSHGDRAVELDALPPEELEKIIAKEIKSYIDSEIWNKELEIIEKQKKKAKKIIEELAKRLEESTREEGKG